MRGQRREAPGVDLPELQLAKYGAADHPMRSARARGKNLGLELMLFEVRFHANARRKAAPPGSGRSNATER